MRGGVGGLLGLAICLFAASVLGADAQLATQQLASTKADVDKAFAAWNEKTADFDRMRTPDSPAFVILGVSPTEIQRPGTPMAVAASLSGFVSGSSAVVPKDLALEVAPYWLYGHPDLTALDYYREGWANALRTLTFSLGTKQTDRQTADAMGVTTDHSDSDLAIGLRSRLHGTGPDQGEDCAKKTAALREAAAALAADAVLSEDALPKLLEKHHNDRDAAGKEYQTMQAKAIEASAAKRQLESAQKDLDRKCFDITASARGWSLDVAVGADWLFLDSIATKSNADLRSGAGWLTLAYASDSLTAAFMARFAGRQQESDWQKLLDAGLRLVYKRRSFALSGEAIARARLAGPGPDATYKMDLVGEYKVTDDAWVTVTFGKTFDAGQGATLFSLANLNWAFGKPTVQ